MGSARRLAGYVWGVFVRPSSTFNQLAAEGTVRWAIAVTALGVLLGWGNMLLFAAFGYDWLGSRPLLLDPTYVGGFGYLRVPAAHWVPIFGALLPVLAAYGLTIVPGSAHLISKLWGGRGTFEQLVNVLAFAGVPSLVINTLSEYITGVPLNLLTHQEHFYGAAMHGAFGPTMQVVWTAYATLVYTIPWLWQIVLGVIGIHRVEHVSAAAATVAMLAAFGLNLLAVSTFVR